MKIYLSSTSIDLKNHRKAVIDGLRIAGHIVVCMEDYPANDVIPVDKCLADVAECELYVGILAWRYGFIPEGSDLSITEQEYRQAQANKIPSLIFIIEDSYEWPIEYRDTGDSLSKLQNLKDEITKQKIVGLFNIPQQLSILVLAAVQPVERDIAYTKRAVMNVEEEKAIMLATIKEQMIKLENQDKQMTRVPIPIKIPNLKGAFMDREAPRDTLHHWLRFDNKQLVAIVAPGGFGKTELTTKILHEIVSIPNIIDNEIHGILYLTCRNADITLGHIFIQAGRIAGKQDAFQQTYANNNISLQRKLEYLFNELSQVGNIWVVMDNFEDLLDAKTDLICDVEINAFMEAASVSDYSVRIIITTRAIPKFEGSRNFALLDLSQGLPEDYAIQYLREVGGDCGIKDEDEELLRSFVNRVHGIPKALESVIGYLNDHFPVITLKHLMDDKSLFADFDAHDTEKGLKKLVAQQFEKQSPDSQLILCALSIFPHPVLIETLRFLLPNFTLPVFAEIIRRLIRNHLINENHGYYDMHPMTKTFIYDRIPSDESLLTDTEKDTISTSLIFSKQCLHSQAADFYKIISKPKEEWQSMNDAQSLFDEAYHRIHASQSTKAAEILDVIDKIQLQSWSDLTPLIRLRSILINELSNPVQQFNNLKYLALMSRWKRNDTQAIEYCRIAKDIVIKYGLSSNYHFEVILKLIVMAFDRSEFENASSLMKDATEIYDLDCNNIDYQLQYQFYQLKGSFDRKEYRINDAIKNYNFAFQIAQKNSYYYGMIVMYGWVGRCQFRIGQYKEGISSITNGLTLAIEKKFHRIQLYRYFELAICIIEYSGNAFDAINNCDDGLKLADEYDDIQAQCKLIIQKCKALKLIGKWCGAKEKLLEVIDCASQYGWNPLVYLGRCALAECMIEGGMYKDALNEINCAIKMMNESNDNEIRIQVTHIFANCLIVNNKLDEALYIVNKSLLEIPLESEEILVSHLNLIKINILMMQNIDNIELVSLFEKLSKIEIPSISYTLSLLHGIFYSFRGDLSGAKLKYETTIFQSQKLLNQCPDLVSPHYSIALAYLGLHDPSKALEAYNKALEKCAAPGVINQSIMDISLLERAIPNTPGLTDAKTLLINTHNQTVQC